MRKRSFRLPFSRVILYLHKVIFSEFNFDFHSVIYYQTNFSLFIDKIIVGFDDSVRLDLGIILSRDFGFIVLCAVRILGITIIIMILV